MTYSTRIILCSFFLLQSVCSLFAQEPKVKWGATISDEKQTKFNIIGADKNAVYVLRFQHDRHNMSVPFFVSLDRNTLQVIKSVEMQIPIPDDGNASMREVYFLKDKFVLMIILTNRKSKQDAALAYVMDKNGAISSNYKMILEVPEARSGNSLDYRFLISPDSTRFMAAIYDNSKGHNYKAAAFDSDLNGIWAADISLDPEIQKRSIAPMAYAMDINNNFFIMVKASSKAIYSNELGNILCVYKSKEKLMKTYDILPPDKLQAYETGRFLSDVDGRTWFTGMYGEKDTDAKGVAIASFKDGKFETAFKPFSDRFRSAFMGDSKAAKGGTVDFLVIDEVIPNKDQSFEVVLHKYAPRVCVAAAAIKFDKNLNEAWSAPLPFYYWQGGEYYTWASMVTDKELCFFHNDHKKNIDIIDPRKASGLNGLGDAVGVITRVNLNDGSVKKQLLFNKENIETYLIPGKCYQSGEKEMLLFAKRKADVNFGKVTLD